MGVTKACIGKTVKLPFSKNLMQFNWMLKS